MMSKKIIAALAAFVLMAALQTGCALLQEQAGYSSASGLKLWEVNCTRCHNVPATVNYSDEEWEIIGSHMRLRAYLSGKETEKIIGFLKTIN